jgi:hypothetical protein
MPPYKNVMLYISFLKRCAQLALVPAWIGTNGIFGALIGGFLMIWRGSISFFQNAPNVNWVCSFALYAAISWGVLFILQMIFISPYCTWKEERESRIKTEKQIVADFSDERQSSVNSKMVNIPLEAKRELRRIITAEIEVRQLNNDVRYALEEIGFITPAFAYTPAEFNEQHRPFIERWFRQNPL